MDSKDFERILAEGEEALRRSRAALAPFGLDRTGPTLTQLGLGPNLNSQRTDNEQDFAGWAKRQTSDDLRRELSRLALECNALEHERPALADRRGMMLLRLSQGPLEKHYVLVTDRIDAIKVELIGRGEGLHAGQNTAPGDIEKEGPVTGARTAAASKSKRALRARKPSTLERLLPNPTSQLALNSRERGPDVQTSRERVAFEDKLRTELASVREVVGKGGSTLADLKKDLPSFELWNLLPLTEQHELVKDEFKPRAYARALATRKYGLTSPETIKKDRQKLLRADREKVRQPR